MCPGLELPAVGCLTTGDMGFDAILALVPVLFGLWMKLLGGEIWRIRIGALLYDASWSSAYAGLLSKLLGALQRLFGRPWSLRALDLCFRLAIVYALFWLVFGLETDALQSETEKRALAGIFFILGPISFVVARSVRRRHLRLRQRVKGRKRRIWLCLREQLAYVAVTGIGFAVAAVGIEAARPGIFEQGTTAFETADEIFTKLAVQELVIDLGGTRALAPTAVLGGVIAGAGAGALAAGGVVVGVGIMAPSWGGAEALALAEFLGLTVAVGGVIGILLVIPFLNSLFDWPSWAASRWMMGRLRADAVRPGFLRRTGALLAHLAIDGIIAIACLFGLAIVLVNLASGLDLPGLWGATLSAAREAPFSARGSTMTVMLASTLVPTALHLFFALFALAAIRPPFHDRIAPWLEDSHGGGEWGNRAIVSAYLTFWAVFALTVLWGASLFVLRGLDWLWLRLGWGLESDPYPFWASIFRAAERFVIF